MKAYASSRISRINPETPLTARTDSLRNFPSPLGDAGSRAPGRTRSTIGELRRDRGVLLPVAALALFLYESHAVGPQYDDAYTSYRYAANLVAGHGLVFNPGERRGHQQPALDARGGARHGARMRRARGGPRARRRRRRPRPVRDLRLRARGRAPRAERVGRCRPVARAGVARLRALEHVRHGDADVRRRHHGHAGRGGVGPTRARDCARVRRDRSAPGRRVAGRESLRIPAARARPARSARRVGSGGLHAPVDRVTAFRLACYGMPLPNTFYAKAGGVWLGVGAFFALVFALGNGGVRAACRGGARARPPRLARRRIRGRDRVPTRSCPPARRSARTRSLLATANGMRTSSGSGACADPRACAGRSMTGRFTQTSAGWCQSTDRTRSRCARSRSPARVCSLRSAWAASRRGAASSPDHAHGFLPGGGAATGLCGLRAAAATSAATAFASSSRPW